MKAITSINHLPVEILRDIFFRLPKPVQPIQMVCKRWREICIASSSLWTDIRIEKHDELSIVESLRLQAQLAKRSGVLPLDVIIRTSFDYADPEDYLAALRELFEQAPTTRWKTLDVALPIPFDTDVFAQGFPQLKAIKLSQFHPSFEYLLKMVNTTSTALEEISIADVWEDYEPHLGNVTGQLRVISVQRIDEPLLDAMKNWKCITGLRVERSSWPDPAPRNLPKIKNLEIVKRGHLLGGVLQCPDLKILRAPGDRMGIFFSLKAPRLEVLEFTSSDSGREKRIRGFVLETAYLPTGIISLSLLDQFHFQEGSKAFGPLNNLKELSILLNYPRQVIDAFDALRFKSKYNPSTGSNLSCPHLEELNIHADGNLEVWRDYDRNLLAQACRDLLSIRRSIGLKYVRMAWTDSNETILFS